MHTPFLENLRKQLCGLPQTEVSERIEFYGEMIDDLMEEGFSSLQDQNAGRNAH